MYKELFISYFLIINKKGKKNIIILSALDRIWEKKEVVEIYQLSLIFY